MDNRRDPVYVQLADNIRKKIATGEYKVGQRIMSERLMAESYGINRLTVRKAIDILIKEGSLVAIRGSGTFVKAILSSDKKVRLGSAGESISLSTVMRQNGFNSSRKVLSFQKIHSTGELASYFPSSIDCYELIRLSDIDGVPSVLQICYFPASFFSEPERFDFAEGSLYTYMEIQGHRPKTIISDMWLRPISEKYEKIMNMDHGRLVFYYEYFGFDKNRQMVEFTKSYYNPTFTSFRYEADKSGEDH